MKTAIQNLMQPSNPKLNSNLLSNFGDETFGKIGAPNLSCFYCSRFKQIALKIELIKRKTL
jgi:hypothetical protein